MGIMGYQNETFRFGSSIDALSSCSLGLREEGKREGYGDTDFDHSWTAEIMSGRDIDEVLATHSDDWTAQVEAFNKLFT